MDAPLATLMYHPRCTSPGAGDAAGTPRPAGMSTKLFRCRDEPLALVLTTSPKLDGPARKSALGCFCSANPDPGTGPAQCSFTGSIGQGTVVEVLVLSV